MSLIHSTATAENNQNVFVYTCEFICGYFHPSDFTLTFSRFIKFDLNCVFFPAWFLSAVHIYLPEAIFSSTKKKVLSPWKIIFASSENDFFFVFLDFGCSVVVNFLSAKQRFTCFEIENT